MNRTSQFPCPHLRRARRAEPRGQGAAQEPRADAQAAGRAPQVPHRREAHQGRHGAVQRPRRPAAHARLRQEVLDQVGRQPDLRRFVDPRLHGAKGKRSAPRSSTGAPSTGCPADVFGSGKVLVFGEVIDKDGTPLRRRHARHPQGVFARQVREETATRSTPPTKSKASSSTGSTPSATIHETRQVRVRQHRRLLPLAARRSAAHVHRHRRRSAARDGLREREGPPGSRALAVRDQLQLRRSRRRGRHDPALQADLPPGRDQPRHDGELPAQAGRRRQRQRHAHQRLGHARAART